MSVGLAPSHFFGMGWTHLMFGWEDWVRPGFLFNWRAERCGMETNLTQLAIYCFLLLPWFSFLRLDLASLAQAVAIVLTHHALFLATPSSWPRRLSSASCFTAPIAGLAAPQSMLKLEPTNGDPQGGTHAYSASSKSSPRGSQALIDAILHVVLELSAPSSHSHASPLLLASLVVASWAPPLASSSMATQALASCSYPPWLHKPPQRRGDAETERHIGDTIQVGRVHSFILEDGDPDLSWIFLFKYGLNPLHFQPNTSPSWTLEPITPYMIDTNRVSNR